MRAPSTIISAIIMLLAAGCAQHQTQIPPELIDAARERAFELPKEFYLNADGSAPDYIMVVRQMAGAKGKDLARTSGSVTQAEWFYSTKGSLTSNKIAALKAFGAEDLYTVSFVPEMVTATNAQVKVTVSYGRRGGNTRTWNFLRTGDEWQLTNDVREMSWD